MIYLGPNDLDPIFDIIYHQYSRRENVPQYQKERDGMSGLLGALEGVKMDAFYPDFFEKAAYLLIHINKGHFFSNGNKRVALVFSLVFILLNNYDVMVISKNEHRKKLDFLFPSFQNYHDYQEFLPEEFGYYNLSLIVAESGDHAASFDDLKAKVIEFLKFSLHKK